MILLPAKRRSLSESLAFHDRDDLIDRHEKCHCIDRSQQAKNEKAGEPVGRPLGHRTTPLSPRADEVLEEPPEVSVTTKTMCSGV